MSEDERYFLIKDLLIEMMHHITWLMQLNEGEEE